MTRQEQFDSLLESWKTEWSPIVDFIFEEGDEEKWITILKRERRHTLSDLIQFEKEWDKLFDGGEMEEAEYWISPQIREKRKLLSRLDLLLEEIEKNFAVGEVPF